jgi:hypothetical protein
MVRTGIIFLANIPINLGDGWGSPFGPYRCIKLLFDVHCKELLKVSNCLTNKEFLGLGLSVATQNPTIGGRFDFQCLAIKSKSILGWKYLG